MPERTQDNPGEIKALADPGMTYRVPVHKLREEGLLKQVGPRIWEALDDITLQVYNDPPIIMSKGSRWYAIDYEHNQTFQRLRQYIHI